MYRKENKKTKGEKIMITRNHIVRCAKLVRTIYVKDEEDRLVFANALADLFEKEKDNFDRYAFLEACGYENAGEC